MDNKFKYSCPAQLMRETWLYRRALLLWGLDETFVYLMSYNRFLKPKVFAICLINLTNFHVQMAGERAPRLYRIQALHNSRINRFDSSRSKHHKHVNVVQG
uniref:Uncharacterized protein n=1 Tax=Candidozyma auris TaxID=498019 RepID=A0A0L0P5J3_CANAR